MIEYWNWVIEKNGIAESLGNRRLILYGCGSFIYKFTSELQIEDVIVIDSSPLKWGESIVLHNRPYRVNSPDVLDKLSPDDWFIVITVQNDCVIEEIKKHISSTYREWADSFCLYSDICREYTDLTSVFLLDPYVHKKIYDSNNSINLPAFLGKADWLISEYITKDTSDIKFSIFILCSRLIVTIRNKKDKYFLYFPCRKNYFVYYQNTLLENYEIRHRLGINKSLLIYDDPEGFMLCRFMESGTDFSNRALISKILDKIHIFHNSGEKIGVKMSLHDEIDIMEKKIELEDGDYRELFTTIHELIIPETLNYDEKIIHGDFSYGNILYKGDEVEIIDWTFMSMGDPMFDVCLFYYYISRNWEHDFLDVLTMYYGRTPGLEEIRHATAWRMLVLYWKYLEDRIGCIGQSRALMSEIENLLKGYFQ